MKKLITPLLVVSLIFILTGCILDQSQTTQPTINPTPVDTPQITDKKLDSTQPTFVDKNKTIRGPLTKLSITFNTEIDEKTLTDKTFYALAGVDEKVPGKISYDKKIKTATITFTDPIIGGTNGQVDRITVNADGVLDLSGKQILLMTYSVDVIK